MQIGIFRDHKIKRINLSQSSGAYEVYGDGSKVADINGNSMLEIQLVSGKLSVRENKVNVGSFAKVKVVPTLGYGSLALNSKSPIVRQRKYEDSFLFKVVAGRMTIVNLVSMSNYLAGVIESEGGVGKHIEYYKVQALMSRTYAMKNKQRHRKEGFHLCDGVHCQAYHSMLRFTKDIRTAVQLTNREVIHNESNNLVTTYFSANCGGQTCDAGYVWNQSEPHCQMFLDTFCIHTNQATWTKRIPQYKWKNYLVGTFGYPIEDSSMASIIYTFEQKQRKAFYIHPSLGIPLRDLRSKFSLKSTFFNTFADGSDVVLKGRGFGHGVGLCQEGAMRMATFGYSYQQIAMFYFTDVHVGTY